MEDIDQAHWGYCCSVLVKTQAHQVRYGLVAFNFPTSVVREQGLRWIILERFANLEDKADVIVEREFKIVEKMKRLLQTEGLELFAHEIRGRRQEVDLVLLIKPACGS
ncbi:hypothetical protein [Marinovum sp.]|uniref:hypothetical protein n=1 Tax=Marinovum sp. TaxID=2024839 RepID=UPI002B268531|nr:hypothetical protein [Marinovum sp.]